MIDPDKKTKQPMYVQFQDTSMFGFAGLFASRTKVNTAANEGPEMIVPISPA